MKEKQTSKTCQHSMTLAVAKAIFMTVYTKYPAIKSSNTLGSFCSFYVLCIYLNKSLSKTKSVLPVKQTWLFQRTASCPFILFILTDLKGKRKNLLTMGFIYPSKVDVYLLLTVYSDYTELTFWEYPAVCFIKGVC